MAKGRSRLKILMKARVESSEDDSGEINERPWFEEHSIRSSMLKCLIVK